MRRYAGMLGAMVARDAYSGTKRLGRALFGRYKKRRVTRRGGLRGTVRRRGVRSRTSRGLARSVQRIVTADKPTNIHTTEFINGAILRNVLYSARLDDIGKGTETGGFEKKRDGWTMDLRGFRIEYYMREGSATTSFNTDVRMLILADYTDYNDEIPVEERFFTGTGEGDFATEALDFGDTRIKEHQKLNRKINGRRYKVIMDKRLVLSPKFSIQNPVRYGKIWVSQKKLVRYHEVTQPVSGSKEIPKPIYRIFLFQETSDNVEHSLTGTIEVKTYFKNH